MEVGEAVMEEEEVVMEEEEVVIVVDLTPAVGEVKVVVHLVHMGANYLAVTKAKGRRKVS